ncbi:hypothetical protein IAR50_007173 [Cryptococcus sp. DSM 104548]
MFPLPFASVIYTITLIATTHAETTFKLTKHSTGTTSDILRKIESLGHFNRRGDLDIDGSTSGGIAYSELGWKLEYTRHFRHWIESILGAVDIMRLVYPRRNAEWWTGGGYRLRCVYADIRCWNCERLHGRYYDFDYWLIPGCSGIWVMARDGAIVDGAPTAISLMYSQGLIEEPIVGFYLGREGDGIESEITIGDISSVGSSYAQTGNKATVQSQNNTYNLYQFLLDSISVSGKTLDSDIAAYTDTGSTAISTPEPLIGEIYDALFDGVAYKYGSSYIVPCEPLANASISLTFGGIAFHMAFRNPVGSDIADNTGWYYGRFVALYKGTEFTVIGDAFLHDVYHTVNVQTVNMTFYGLP